MQVLERIKTSQKPQLRGLKRGGQRKPLRRINAGRVTKSKAERKAIQTARSAERIALKERIAAAQADIRALAKTLAETYGDHDENWYHSAITHAPKGNLRVLPLSKWRAYTSKRMKAINSGMFLEFPVLLELIISSRARERRAKVPQRMHR